MMSVHNEFAAYRQYQDQIVQELRQPQHARYLQANLVAGDAESFEKYCRQFIDELTGPELPDIARRLYRDVPPILREYLVDDQRYGANNFP